MIRLRLTLASPTTAATRASRNHRFVGPLVAAVVDPGHNDLVALRTALELERQERILGYCGSPLCREHRLVAPGYRDVFDEPGGNDLAPCILAQAGLHLVAHEYLDLGRITDAAGADFHRICHQGSSYSMAQSEYSGARQRARSSSRAPRTSAVRTRARTPSNKA